MILSTIISFSIALLVLISAPHSAHAQQNTNPPGSFEQAPLETQDDGQVGGTLGDYTGNNWWWLLPLIAIPIIFYVLKKGNDSDSHAPSHQDENLVGSKGGHTRRRERETEIDDL